MGKHGRSKRQDKERIPEEHTGTKIRLTLITKEENEGKKRISVYVSTHRHPKKVNRLNLSLHVDTDISVYFMVFPSLFSLVINLSREAAPIGFPCFLCVLYF